MSDEYKAAKVIVGITAAIAHFPLSAYVVQQLWTWHVTPVFGNDAPGLWRCLGLCILASALTHQNAEKLENEYQQFGYLIIQPLVLLFIGWMCR